MNNTVALLFEICSSYICGGLQTWHTVYTIWLNESANLHEWATILAVVYTSLEETFMLHNRKDQKLLSWTSALHTDLIESTDCQF